MKVQVLLYLNVFHIFMHCIEHMLDYYGYKLNTFLF